ncbi:MAG: AAA family ATPase [Parachlamydiaceae bacterium]|nr:AAA family ATPase [Parachlamydiaceae bacterium]
MSEQPPFAEIFGNDPIKRHLTQMVVRNSIGHSLLFAGPEGVGKSLFAEEFAKMILCRNDPAGSHLYKLNAGMHPDLHIYRPEGKIGMHSLAAMRSLSEEVYLPPYETDRKVFIIYHADRMLSYSANALLKTFEEPSPETVILLLSSSPELLLPTILSRCSVFRFHALSDEEMISLLMKREQLSLEHAMQITNLSQGSVTKALRLCQKSEDPIRALMIEMLTFGKFESYSLLAAKAKQLAELIEESMKHAETTSKEELLKAYCDKPTPTQKEGMEKEIDGIVAMCLMNEAEAFFDILLTWFRDLHLLKLNGNTKYLYNGDRLEALQKAVKNPVTPLEDLLGAVKATKLSLARSTPLHLCLENLFLRLEMIKT